MARVDEHGRERFFKAVLSDEQIEAMEAALSYWLEIADGAEERDASEREHVMSGLRALQNAEVIT